MWGSVERAWFTEKFGEKGVRTMKKTTKILSLLMALVMIFSLTTVALADSSDVELGSDKNNVTLDWGTPNYYSQGLAPAYDVAYKAVGETGIYQRLPIYGNATVKYKPANWAIPKTGSVKVSEEGIIDNFSFTLDSWKGTPYTGNTGLQFNYTAVKAGTVTVTVTYYYKFSPSGWYGETATFKVVVSDGEVDPATKPDKPTVDDIEGFYNKVNSTSSSKGAVYMWCDTYDHHAWFDYITDVDAAYTLGDVVANDGSVLSKSTYPWVCVMTLDANKYLDAYNDELGDECGTHYLKDGQAATESVTWYYNAKTSEWQYSKADAPVYIDITHKAPAATEYTVTYTDGVNGTAFADQVYTVKVGEATPAFEGTPAREGYVFLGWEPEVAETVTGNATYTAQWEEALTTVTVKSNIKDGKLLFLHDTFTVTATANTSADITLSVVNGATDLLNNIFKVTDTKVSEDGKTTTFTLEVIKIPGNYQWMNINATATKGEQEPVTSDKLAFGVNLRNRIHVTVTRKVGGEVVTDASVQLMHKYPKWNTCPLLKFDAAKNEYVMKNAWDLSNQEYNMVNITIGDKTYSVNKTSDGRDLMSVVRAGTEEIYVNYVVVDPIKVTINVDGKQVAQQEFEGSDGEVLSYKAMLKAVFDSIFDSDTEMPIAMSTTGLNADNQAVFGETANVTINITTK